MKKVLVLDNYDSFTYNLVHYIEASGDFQADVFRNDEIDLSLGTNYDYIILSPGPGLPAEAGLLKKLILKYARSKKILGVCLGHQAIGEVFGGELRNLDQVYHGMATEVFVTDRLEPLFAGIPSQFKIGRYHSWVLDKEKLPEAFMVTAVDEDGEIMALRHRTFNIIGVQFHPESILTQHGHQIIQNWLYSS